MTTDVAQDNFVGRFLAGRYEVLRKLNQGGSSAVYLAIQKPLERPVALKILLRRHADDPTAIKRFEKEALAVSRLPHGHVITLYDFGNTEDGDLYIAMEYLNGQSLRDLLDAAGFVPWDRALHIVKGITAALVAAADAGIIHRDLKPDNVMLIESNGDMDFVKVLDFGLAGTVIEDDARLSRADVVAGTPTYLSPERAKGTSDDPRSDLYSLGALFFELLVGQPPFAGDNPIRIILRHLHEEPAAPSEARPEAQIPGFIDDLVLSLLKKRPEERPRCARDLLQTLEAIDRPRGWHVSRGNALALNRRTNTDMSEFAQDAVALVDDFAFALEEGEPLPLVRKKTPTPLLLTQRKRPVRVPEPVMLIEPNPQPTAPSLAETIQALGRAHTVRDIAELCAAFLRGRFDRVFVVDLRTMPPSVLAASGIATATAVAAMHDAGSILLRLAAQPQATYGAPSDPAWLPCFRALGGETPGAIFAAGLKWDGAPAIVFYGDHREPNLRPAVQDAMELLRAAAAALATTG